MIDLELLIMASMLGDCIAKSMFKAGMSFQVRYFGLLLLEAISIVESCVFHSTCLSFLSQNTFNVSVAKII